MKVAGVVLAAGAAARMGRNKLLLEVAGETLLRRAATTALAAGLDPVIVVLGHDAERAGAELAGLPCVPVVNLRHARGMNTSLDAGLAAIPAAAGAAVVLLADMPLVDEGMIRAVVARHGATGAPVVSSRYGDVVAPPTLYARALFSELAGWEGDGRGREVVRRHRAESELVDFAPSRLADVDEPADLERARARLAEDAP